MNSGKVGFNYCMNLIFNRFKPDNNINIIKKEDNNERITNSRKYSEENQGFRA